MHPIEAAGARLVNAPRAMWNRLKAFRQRGSALVHRLQPVRRPGVRSDFQPLEISREKVPTIGCCPVPWAAG